MSSSSPIPFPPIKLNEPSLIGLLASFALHSLLFVFPGIVLWKAPEPKPRGSFTRVVTLSSEEQKRLPELFSQDIPEFPNNTITTNPLLPDKPAPKPSLLSQPAPLPPPPPAPTSLTLPSLSTPNPFKIATDITKPPIGKALLPRTLLPPPTSKATPVPPQAPSPSSPTEAKPKPETPDNPAKNTKTKIDPNNQFNRTFPALTQPSTPPPIDIKPETTNSDRETQLTPEEQKLVAAIRKTRQIRPQQEPKTTDEEANRNYVDWLVRVEKLETEQLNISGIYPQDACLQKLEGTNVYGVLVDTEGKAIQIKLIKGSGHRVFNEHGVEAIFAKTFENNTQQSLPYLVRVKFSYNSGVCSLPSAAAGENQNSLPTPRQPLPVTPANLEPPVNNLPQASQPLETTKKPVRSLQDLIAPAHSNTPPHRTLPENFEAIKAPSHRAPIIFRDKPKAAQDTPEKTLEPEPTSRKN